MDPVQKPASTPKIKVFVNPDLEDLIPGFILNREQDVKRLDLARDEKDFNLIRAIAHDLKGTGGGYGFEVMSVIGGKLEEAAMKSDLSVIETEIKKLKDYLASIEVSYMKNPVGESL